MDTRPPKNKYRAGIGSKYKINANNSLSFCYLHDREIVAWNPTVIHIFKLSYLYDIK